MGALQVWPNGMTLENYRNMVAGSYGYRESPGTYGNYNYVCLVVPFGGVNDRSTFNNGSYGMIYAGH